MIALLAVGHIYVALGKLLFLLPASETACELSTLRYGPATRKWEKGSNPTQANCAFRQFVEPGALIPVWGDAGQGDEDLEVTYEVGKEGKAKTVTLKQESFKASSDLNLSAAAHKVKSSVRVEVKNDGDAPVLAGDAVVARSKPRESCEGNGPTAAIPPGETLVDIRPGLLSPSMKAWVAVFTSEKDCSWHGVGLRKRDHGL
jgi:hypothetical protein